jgi:energy-coupling factor transporter ATP-binding protein EcfA2
MKTKKTYGIKISRDDKTLISFDFAHNKSQPSNHLKFNLNLKAKDNNHLFSFYGENGSGKSTICDKITSVYNKEKNHRFQSFYKTETLLYKNEINNCKVINIKDELSLKFDYICSIFNTEKKFIKYSDFFRKNNIDKILDLNNKNPDLYKSSSIFDIIDKTRNIERYKKKRTYEIKKYNKIIKLTNIFFENKKFSKDKSYEFDMEHNIYFYYKKDETFLFHIIDILEHYGNENKISIENIINNYEKFKESIFLFDKTEVTEVLSDEKIGRFILDYLKYSYNKSKNIIKDYKNKIRKNNKIIEFINEHLRKDFLLISDNFIQDMEITNRYNTFLNMNCGSIYLKKKDHHFANRYTVEEIIDNSSEGQVKLIKLLFILSKIGIEADNKTIIIADDIFDSFDNKNTINVMKILNKVLSIRRPILIFFTHEFEIFGSFNKIFKINDVSSFFISRDKETLKISNLNVKETTLEEYVTNKLKAEIPIQIKIMYFLVLSVYGRNLIERTLGQKNIYYELLTSLIHLKLNSLDTISTLERIADLNFFNSFTVKDIEDIKEYSKKFKNYFMMIKSIFRFTQENKIPTIELNIFLSLYARLYIEFIILNDLKKKGVNINNLLLNIKAYQTGYLLNEYKKNEGDIVQINILNDYLTKFIHINQGLSYLMNIDSGILIKLIKNIKCKNSYKK